jgi:hypothetical protein
MIFQDTVFNRQAARELLVKDQSIRAAAASALPNADQIAHYLISSQRLCRQLVAI